MDALGDRMKRYESVYNQKLTPRMPVIIRVDGQHFHSLTKCLKKPFDPSFMGFMEEATSIVATIMQGFKLAYTQSDEASFLITDFDSLETQGWFDYELNKIVSTAAAKMSVAFLKRLHEHYAALHNSYPTFDARAFILPIDDVSNYFLWRSLDWKRNSVQMLAQSVFSHKQLHKKNQADMRSMLLEKGCDWEKLSVREKYGSWFYKKDGCLYNDHEDRTTFETVNDLVTTVLLKPTLE